MTVGHYTTPRQRVTITHTGTDYLFDDVTMQSQVTRRENAAMYATIQSMDVDWINLNDRCDIADTVKIEYKWVDNDDTYTQVFGGYIRDLARAAYHQLPRLRRRISEYDSDAGIWGSITESA
jgi:hypothetical protein